MDGVVQITGFVMLVSPVIGAIASGMGRIWGNVLTALACGAWAGLVFVAVLTSGETRGPYIPIALALAGAATIELVLAWLLAARREAGRTDEGAIRAGSVVVALGAMGLVVVLVGLIVAEIVAFNSLL